jgi:hypothetical protein
MDVGARETEDALKKELAETKDQVTVLKERTAEVRHGKCLVHCYRRGVGYRNRLNGRVTELVHLKCRSGEGAWRPQGRYSVRDGPLRTSRGGGGAEGADRPAG